MAASQVQVALPMAALHVLGQRLAMHRHYQQRALMSLRCGALAPGRLSAKMTSQQAASASSLQLLATQATTTQRLHSSQLGLAQQQHLPQQQQLAALAALAAVVHQLHSRQPAAAAAVTQGRCWMREGALWGIKKAALVQHRSSQAQCCCSFPLMTMGLPLKGG
jgi:hypothetical protein